MYVGDWYLVSTYHKRRVNRGLMGRWAWVVAVCEFGVWFGGWCGEVGGDRYGVDMRGVERGIYPRSNMPRSFPKNQKTKIRSVSSWNLRDANTRRLNILLPKKEDLAKGLKCSNSGGLVNDKYWHVKDAAGGFSGQVWWRCEVRLSKWKLKSYSYVWGTRVFFPL